MRTLIKRTRKFIFRILATISINPRISLKAMRNIPWFIRCLNKYRQLNTNTSIFHIETQHIRPILTDLNTKAGKTGHYFHQDLWAARKIRESSPAIHVDISSRVDGFIGHLVTFRDVIFIDYLPLGNVTEGLFCIQANGLELPLPDDTVTSLSCLHVIEHFGLGRYGDPIDPKGYISGIKELQRVLAPNGDLYFSVPIGRERLEFNAHRVFSPLTPLEYFDELNLVEFSVIDDQGIIRRNSDPKEFLENWYSCGLYHLTK